VVARFRQRVNQVLKRTTVQLSRTTLRLFERIQKYTIRFRLRAILPALQALNKLVVIIASTKTNEVVPLQPLGRVTIGHPSAGVVLIQTAGRAVRGWPLVAPIHAVRTHRYRSGRVRPAVERHTFLDSCIHATTIQLPPKKLTFGILRVQQHWTRRIKLLRQSRKHHPNIRNTVVAELVHGMTAPLHIADHRAELVVKTPRTLAP